MLLRKNNGQRKGIVVLQLFYYAFVPGEPKINANRLNLTSHYDANFTTQCIYFSGRAVKRNLGSMNGKLIRTNFKAKHKEIYRLEPSVSHQRTLTQHKILHDSFGSYKYHKSVTALVVFVVGFFREGRVINE